MQARAKVLVIEDNVELLGILQQLLSADYEVATARRGEDGVRIATSFHPDLVILDLHLPKMDGIEAGRWIKREVEAVRILVLTALAGPGDADTILASGCCDAYMAKPATLAEIRGRVADLLMQDTAAR